MSISISDRICSALKAADYRPLKARPLARSLGLNAEEDYPHFRAALRDLEDEGVVETGPGGGYVLTASKIGQGEVIGLYSGTKRGFGFIDVREPVGHPQLFITEFDNDLGAVSGDVVRVKVLKGTAREPGDLERGRVLAIVKRANARLVGTLQKSPRGDWYVLPDGHVFKEPIATPDAAGKYIAPGQKSSSTSPPTPRTASRARA
ncbi:MAG: hypothetical protein QM770_15200 [Tepidisphaeraceae bacterium]